MQTKHIKAKLEEMGISLAEIPLGDFDAIGEFTAKRTRQPTDKLYKEVGCFYRANYERGILIYYLIKTKKLDSFLEIGFGRGYSTMCAAKAFRDMGKAGKIVTIDPSLTKESATQLTQVFPREWFEGITFFTEKSETALPKIDGKFDLIYVDGDHRYEAVKRDWELIQGKWRHHVLFDDYHMPSKKEEAIECAKLIDEIDDPSKELIIMDRRIFFDDRQIPDDKIDYGQVLLTRAAEKVEREDNPAYLNDWLDDK